MAEKIINNIKLPNGEVCKISGLDGKLTNCLLEVPQRIKLELNNGTITLKAGSKVYVPRPNNEFLEVTTSKDLSYKYSSGSYKSKLFYNLTTNSVFGETATGSGSGINPPQAYYTYYNTNSNVVRRSINGSTWLDDELSLPLCDMTSTQGIGITSIDQVFNGMGYIGSTVWVDKGVRGLIPNGRNEDGTLRNIEKTLDRIYLNNNANPNRTLCDLIYNIDLDVISKSSIKYKVSDDGYIYNDNGELRRIMVLGTFSTDSTDKITSFQPKQPFRAVDWNDLINKEIGKPQISLDSNLPSGCVWLEGSTVSRTTYASLFAIYGTTYGEGDGSTTFVLPDFRNRAIWGSNGFGYISAGLPNITGSIAFGPCNTAHQLKAADGAFYVGWAGNAENNGYGGLSWTNTGAGFNASRSSSIYGNSSTVQPPAIKVRVYTRYQ